MGALTCLKQGPGATPHHVHQMAGRDMVAVFASRAEGVGWGIGRLPVLGGIDVRLAHQLPGKPAEGHAPHWTQSR